MLHKFAIGTAVYYDSGFGSRTLVGPHYEGPLMIFETCQTEVDGSRLES
jgi:hypothetical protein